jgi:uncharacterized protein (DUF433 family)
MFTVEAVIDEQGNVKIFQPVLLQGSRRALVVVLDEPASIPNFPHIELAKFTGGESAVIRGTRVKVSSIIGYLSMGETPQTIVEQVLPFLKIEQVIEVQRYYESHKEEIDKERGENTEEAGRKYLRDKLGEESYRKLTGE